jgi:hypothetical protein
MFDRLHHEILVSSVFTASQSCGSPRRLITQSRSSNHSYSTDANVKTFMGAHVFLGASETQVDSVADKYSQDPAAVSPFA